MTKRTPLQKISAIQKAKKLHILHEYYEDHPMCTGRQAISDTEISSFYVQIYSKIRTEFKTDAAIVAEIDTRFPNGRSEVITHAK